MRTKAAAVFCCSFVASPFSTACTLLSKPLAFALRIAASTAFALKFMPFCAAACSMFSITVVTAVCQVVSHMPAMEITASRPSSAVLPVANSAFSFAPSCPRNRPPTMFSKLFSTMSCPSSSETSSPMDKMRSANAVPSPLVMMPSMPLAVSPPPYSMSALKYPFARPSAIASSVLFPLATAPL